MLTQNFFVKQLISIIDKGYAEYYLNDATISCWVRGKKNLSPKMNILVNANNKDDILYGFSENILPLLDENKKYKMCHAIKDLIFNDTNILDDCEIELFSKITKKDLLINDICSIDKFLCGLFLYVLINSKNKGTTEHVNEITDEFIDKFENTNNFALNENGLTFL